MKRITALFLLICMISIISCKKNDTTSYTTDLIETDENIPTEIPPTYFDTEEIPANEKKFSSSARQIMYDNMYFYRKSLPDKYYTIRYQYVDEIIDEGHSIYTKTGEPSDGLFSSSLIKAMAIDYNATEKNGGIPVIIVVCRQKGAPNYSLISFNMANEKSNVILQDMGTDDLELFYVYGDTVYYPIHTELSPAKVVVKMHSIKTNGKDMKEYSAEFVNMMPKISIHNDKIYYTLDTTRDPYVYVSDLNFENSRKLMKLEHTVPNPAIKDGYIYYADDERILLVDENPIPIHSIYKRSLDNFESSQPELVLKNIYSYHYINSKLVYYTKDDIIKLDGYYAPCTIRVYDVNTQDDYVLISSPKKDDSTINISTKFQSDYMKFEKGKYVEGKKNDVFLINVNTGKIYPFPNDI